MISYCLFIALTFFLHISTFGMQQQTLNDVLIANAYYQRSFSKCDDDPGYLTCNNEDDTKVCLPITDVQNIFFANLAFFINLSEQDNERDDRNFMEWARTNQSKSLNEFISSVSPYNLLRFAYQRVLNNRNRALEDALHKGSRSGIVQACNDEAIYCGIRSGLDVYIGAKTISTLITNKQTELQQKDN